MSKPMRDNAPDFVLFCTIDPYDQCYVIGTTNNEIDAVSMFRAHVGAHGDRHIPHIHMERRRAEWPRVGHGDCVYLDLDAADNLFRVPPNMVDRMAKAMP